MDKEYAECIERFDVESMVPYEATAGVYKDSTNTQCFIFEVIDLRTKKVYTDTFNSEWMANTGLRSWFASVYVSNMVRNIDRAIRAQKDASLEAWKQLKEVVLP